MNKNLSETKNILIVPSTKVNPDSLWAASALSKTLAENEKEVKILLNDNNFPQFMDNLVTIEEKLKLNEITNKNYKISLLNTDLSIENVTWEQESGKVHIIVSTKSGQIDPQSIKVDALQKPFDRIIYVGRVNTKKLGDFYESEKEQFLDENITKIDLKYDESGKIYSSKTSSSLSETVFDFINDNNLKLSQNAAEDLVSGIYWRTDSLKKIRSAKTFVTLKILTDAGANISKSSKRGFRSLKLIETKLIAEILKNIKITKDKVAFAKVNLNDVNNIKLSEIIYPNWNLLEYLSDAKSSALIVTSENTNTVYLNASANNEGIKKLIKKYNGKGNGKTGIFRTNEQIEKVEGDIRLHLGMGGMEKEEIEAHHEKLRNDIIIHNEKEKNSKPQPNQKREIQESPLAHVSEKTQTDQQNEPKDTVKENNKMEKHETTKTKVPEDKSEDQLTQDNEAEKEEESREERKTNFVNFEKPTIAKPIMPTVTPMEPQPPMVPIASPTPAETMEQSFESFDAAPLYDPLAPATALPEPLDLSGGKKKEQKPKDNSPLPSAN